MCGRHLGETVLVVEGHAVLRELLMSAEVTPEMESAAWSGGAVAVLSKGDLPRELHVHFPSVRTRLVAAA